MKIYKVLRSNGIYYGRFKKPDEKMTMRSLYTRNKKESDDALDDLKFELRQKGWEIPKITDGLSFRQAVSLYLAAISKRKSRSWVEKQGQYLNGPMMKFFGAETKVAAALLMTDNYCNARAEEVRGVTVNKELACLRSFGKFLKTKHYITKNSAREVDRMDDEIQIIRRFLSEEEYKFLIPFAVKQVEEDPYFHIGNHFRDLPEFIQLAVHTGPRLGELLHIEFRDVMNNTLFVRQKPKLHFSLKSHQERQIPLCKKATEAIEEMRLKRNEETDLIFWRHGGKRQVQESFSRLVEAASREMPSLKDVTIHTLRKTFASWLV